MQHILKCETCKIYTLKDICLCGAKTVNPRPQKYSPEDPYAKYRRIAKHEKLIKEGFLNDKQ